MAWARVGWIISENKKLIKAMTAFNTNQISSPPTENQLMSIPVVNWETKNTIEWYNKILLQNREIAKRVLEHLDMKYVEPKWSFYIFPEIINNLTSNTNKAVFDYCLNTAKQENWVVVIPGEAFWETTKATNNIRISLAVDPINFEEAMDRFKKTF
jgi:aspartate/methionine/tyrosine aminotransferase